MEKLQLQSTYTIPLSRTVKLSDLQDKLVRNRPATAEIIHPLGFKTSFKIQFKEGVPCVTIPSAVNGKRLNTNVVRLEITTHKGDEEEKVKTVSAVSAPARTDTNDQKKLSNEKITKRGVLDYLSQAIANTKSRADRLAKQRYVAESKALKPEGLSGLKILTADDVDYTRGVCHIHNLNRMHDEYNSDVKQINHKKHLCEYFDVMSFSGLSSIIGFYLALGNKAKGNGNLEYLMNWYQTELPKALSMTGKDVLIEKGKQTLGYLKLPRYRKKPNPGFSLKNIKRVVGSLFLNPYSRDPFMMSDILCEVYQPLILDDERAFVYSRASTPNARIVDVIINTSLDPNYFQTERIENMGVSLGPVRRSFDLPIAQHNTDIKIVSIGAELTYQESEKDIEVVNPAQNAFLSKRKHYRIDYEDTKEFMRKNSLTVKYVRVEAPQIPEVSEYSVSVDDLILCRHIADQSKTWTNSSNVKEVICFG